MTARTLMVQGTSSSVGKSLLVAALCRLFVRRGLRVAPFKAQNMSNNAAVCADGSEIGRAQAVQAAAARIEPTAELNPVLLKPEADARSQVIVRGRPWGSLPSGSYRRRREFLWPVVTEALDRLREQYDVVVIEGAGSPVELNLSASDIVNMAVARYAGSPVLLLGDIDRGGIFAQLLGTLWLLTPGERALVRGLVINKFRGDRDLFIDGVRILEERGGVPVLGVIPYLRGPALPEEDAVALDGMPAPGAGEALDIAVIQLPHIANFDDFDPLSGESGVRVRYVASVATLGRPHAVIVPGTKSTLADLAWLREQGLDRAIQRLAGEGAAVVGICGGYQMLGRVIADPDGVESSIGRAAGLGLLPVETVFAPEKATYRVRARVLGGPGWLSGLAGEELEGYEIHMGRTNGGETWLHLQRQGQMPGLDDGSVVAAGCIWGCYVHGLFASRRLRRAWLASLGWKESAGGDGESLDAALDRLADAVGAALNLERLDTILDTQV